MKGIFFGVVALFLVGIWFARRRYAARALRDIDSGRRCLSCNSDDVAAEGTGLRCQKCGYLATGEALAQIGQAHVDHAEMAEMARPDELNRRF